MNGSGRGVCTLYNYLVLMEAKEGGGIGGVGLGMGGWSVEGDEIKMNEEEEGKGRGALGGEGIR